MVLDHVSSTHLPLSLACSDTTPLAIIMHKRPSDYTLAPRGSPGHQETNWLSGRDTGHLERGPVLLLRAAFAAGRFEDVPEMQGNSACPALKRVSRVAEEKKQRTVA